MLRLYLNRMISFVPPTLRVFIDMRLITFALVISSLGLFVSCAPTPIQTAPSSTPPPQPTFPPEWTPTSLDSVDAIPSVDTTPAEAPLTSEYDPSLWLIELESESWEAPELIQQLDDGSIILVHNPKSDRLGLTSPHVVRINLTGELLWAKTIPDSFAFTKSSPGPDNRVLLSGIYERGDERSEVGICLQANGSIAWVRDFNSMAFQDPEDGSVIPPADAILCSFEEDLEFEDYKQLSFGDPFFQSDFGNPFPGSITHSRHPFGDTLHSGTTGDLVDDPGNLTRSQTGREVAVWFIRFDEEDEIVWKNYFPIVNSLFGVGDSTEDGSLVFGSTFRPTGYGTALPDRYVWVMKLNGDGEIIYQRRFLDLSHLDGILATSNFGLLIYGRGFGENVVEDDGFEQQTTAQGTLLVKLDGEGNIEWTWGLEPDITLLEIVELEDGTFLGSIEKSGKLVRFGPDGIINYCDEFYAQSIQMQDDNDPPKTDMEDSAEIWQDTILRSSEPTDFQSLLPLRAVDVPLNVIDHCFEPR